ncbi:MAG TPA: ribonuclease P protein component [Oculatellaceae cyanobacterium]
MLKKVNRLKSRKDFKKALAGKRVCANDCFALYGLPALPSPATASGRPPEPKIGFIVSKKIHKRAVRRNLIRRRLRELTRRVLLGEAWELARRFRVLVFIARSGSVEADFQTLSRRMTQCLELLRKTEDRC